MCMCCAWLVWFERRAHDRWRSHPGNFPHHRPALALLAFGNAAIQMVGISLGTPRSCHVGRTQMREALGKLRGPDGLDNITVVKDDASSIRCKARWRDALFTLTLTCNTGYIHVQGPSSLLLAFGSHVASITGGALHVAKAPGPPPCNPPEQGPDVDPELERPPVNATQTSRPLAAENATQATQTSRPLAAENATQTSRPLAAEPGPGGESVAFSASEGSSHNVLVHNAAITINEAELEGALLSGMLRRLLRISQSRSESN